MPQPKPIYISPATRYQNAALNYYLELTGSPYLHYGYWEPLPVCQNDLTIAKLRTAQEAYTVKLFSFIPAGTNTVLDVGCGIGGNAAYLKERGFTVEGLAPDPFQQQMFVERTNGQVPFHLTRFEDFPQNHSYDLILFSESSQYMAADDLAQGAARLLNGGGYLLLADMIRTDGKYNEGIFSNCHVSSVLHDALTQAGFSLVKTEDISAQVAPTIDLGIANFRTFGLSTIKYIANLLAIAVPPIYHFLRWIFNRWVKNLIVEGLEARKIFDKHLCYQIQLWQLSKKDHENSSPTA
ncbi:methyltransferase domain-containing protein [Fortiea contorta]|uniref:class I SAM-dependent methyltransferase n=1 Tax=Fortiea contorta TaxID=1892405 RepID=UPI0003723D2B